jgi:hypothetical protein
MAILRGLILALAFSCVALPALAAKRPPVTRGVPEIDPAGLASAAALLTGGAFLLFPRRARRPSDRG